MAISGVKDVRCPRCLKADRVRPASSDPARFPPPRPRGDTTPARPWGAVILAYLLASLPFLVGSFSQHLADWPLALSTFGDFLPRPLPSAVVGAICLLVALDRGTRDLLVRLARAAVLDPRLYRELETIPAPYIPVAQSVGLAGLGWGVFLGMRSLDLGMGVSGSQGFVGPESVQLALHGFLVGGLTVLAGWPASCWLMARVSRVLAEEGFIEEAGKPFASFVRNTGYAYSLLPLLVGLAQSSGIPVLVVPALCWFLAAIVVAVGRTMNAGIELVLATALLGVGLPSLAFLFVPGSVLSRAANLGWTASRPSDAAPRDLQSLWLSIALALAMVPALTALLTLAWGRWKGGRLPPARQPAMLRWKQLLYCERCDGVHLADQREFVPASQSEGLLLGDSQHR